MPESKDYYEILQVSKEATSEEIKAAFRRLARQYHPDLNPDHTSSEKFREICEAYEVLSQANGSHQGDRIPHTQGNGQLSDRHFYVQGVEKALHKDYQAALTCLNQAIQLNPRFFEAYLKRCEVRYRLGDDRGVLEDCHQIGQINPRCAQAFYYQGRSRLRLGYPESAIEAYTQAIRLEDNYAQAYYYRGLAYQELKATESAVKDIQTAAKEFRTQEDWSGYQLATATLKNLNQGWGIGIMTQISSILGDAVKALKTLIVNPVGGLLPAFARLERGQAAVTGIFYGIIADLGFLGGCILGLPGLEASLLSLGLIGIVPFVSLVVTSAIARFVFGRRGSFAGDLFLAGASVLPLGLLALIVPVLPISLAVIASVFAGCYTILLLYSGCTQISNLSEAKAAFVVPIILLVSSWLFYQAFTLVMGIG